MSKPDPNKLDCPALLCLINKLELHAGQRQLVREIFETLLSGIFEKPISLLPPKLEESHIRMGAKFKTVGGAKYHLALLPANTVKDDRCWAIMTESNQSLYNCAFTWAEVLQSLNTNQCYRVS